MLCRTSAPVIALLMVLQTTQSGSPAVTPIPAPALTPSTVAIPLVAGVKHTFELTKGREQVYTFSLKKGQFAEVFIQQSEGLLEAVVTSPDGKGHTPRMNDGGRTSLIDAPVVADESGVYSICVGIHVAEPGGSGAIILSMPHSATAMDRQQARAQSLLARAEMFRRTGGRRSWPVALRDYDRVITEAQSMKDSNLLRAALTGKSRIYLYRLEDYKDSLVAAQLAVAVQSGGGDLPGQALAWKTLDSIEYYLGDYTASIAAAHRALALYKATGDQYWRGIVFGNLAYKDLEIGETRSGLTSAQSALEIARSINDLFGVDFDLETLGALYLERGEMEQAYETYQQALDALKKQPYPEEAAAVWNGIGELDIQLNDDDHAADAFQKSLPLCLEARDAAGELKVLSNLGEIRLREHRPRAAEEYFRRALERAQSLGLPREQSFLLGGHGRSYAADGDRARALSAFQKAVSIAHGISQMDSEALALQGLGDLYAAAKQPAQAAAAYQKEYGFWKDEGNRGRMAVALASMARLDFKMRRFNLARAKIENALGLIESSRATLASRELRTSYFVSKHNYYDLAVSILMELWRLHPHEGYATQALAMAERARARTLLDSLDRAHAPSLAGVPPRLVARKRRVEEQLTAAYQRLRDALGQEPARPAVIRELHTRIEDLLHTSDGLEAQMRDSSATYAELARGEPVQASDLERQVVDNHSALLEYWAGARQSYLWIVRSHRIESVMLPSEKDLASLVRQYRADLLARSIYPSGEGFVRRTGRLDAADARLGHESLDLGRLLLGSVAKMPGVQTLYIVPDGSLWSLPFAALRIRAPGQDEEGQRSKHTEYAVARFDLVEEPSASVLLSLMRRRSGGGKTKRVAIFADPVYTAGDSRVTGRAGPGEPAQTDAAITRWVTEAGVAHLPRLVGSRDEALAIASLAGVKDVTLHMGFDAQPATVRGTDWKRYSVAHFATHAMVNPDHPAFSGIVLSMVGRHGSPEDGVLWLNDIYALRMPVSLVVLSGCRTATGKQIPGEGIAGLSQAFFFAGARRVVGSLWSIEDQETPQLMRIFYRNLLVRHLSATASLRAAQLEMARITKWSAPYYWASLTLEGLPN